MDLFWNRLWYGAFHPLQWVLRPFSWLYQGIVYLRRRVLQAFCQQKFSVPIIVVGNITVGGVGKTPLVIALANKIQENGLRVGIVSRGYKTKLTNFPYEVQPQDCAMTVGDEPLLLALKTHCPVVIAPKRNQAVRYLLDKHQSQIIISDDGLQHHRMGRAIELLVMDGLRGLGNGWCLPAGPLRESKKRLEEVDFIVVNHNSATEGVETPFVCNLKGSRGNVFAMTLKPGPIKNLASQKETATQFFDTPCAAVAAIGHPQRFYSTLDQLGIQYEAYFYPDHYLFRPNDLNYAQSLIIMTEKDAVKCVSFRNDTIYYLPVEAVLNDAFWNALWSHQQLLGYC